MSHILHKTADWHEGMGDCLFFHFDDFESPPTVVCATPMDDLFDKEFWTHFVVMNFNLIFEQAQQANEV